MKTKRPHDATPVTVFKPCKKQCFDDDDDDDENDIINEPLCFDEPLADSWLHFFKQQCCFLLIQAVTGIRMCTQKAVLDQHVHIGQAGRVPC